MKVSEAIELLEEMPPEANLYTWISSNGWLGMCTPKEFKLNPDGDAVAINLKTTLKMKDPDK